jgi:hypothetical protein
MSEPCRRLNERNYSPLVARPARTFLIRTALTISWHWAFVGVLSKVGFVGFNDLAFAADWIGGAFRFGHGFTDAMRHEPSGLIGDIQSAVELMSGEAFLRRRVDIDGMNPRIECDLAALENGANGHGKGLLAGTALVDTGTCGLALELGRLVDGAAMGADLSSVEGDHKPIARYVKYIIGYIFLE